MENTAVPKNWYVAYTFPNAEKSIHKNLDKMQITSFLPLRAVTRLWGDRKKTIFTPLFPNYIFVYSSLKERYGALAVQGMIKYVSFNGKLATVEDGQIQAIKKILDTDVEVHSISRNNRGDKVLITKGPFCGVEGTIEEINGKSRLVVTINCLNRAVSVHLTADAISSFVKSK